MSSLASTSEETARDFFDHILRIPNPEKVLNSVLGRLERSRQGLMIRERISEEADCEESVEVIIDFVKIVNVFEESQVNFYPFPATFLSDCSGSPLFFQCLLHAVRSF